MPTTTDNATPTPSRNVLVVDDDPITRRVIEATLTECGHSVTVSSDGAEAWNRIKDRPPHVVITDWNMPGLTGIELVRRIRMECKSYVYVLLVTSRSTEEDAVAAIDAGADDFLAKPIVQQELVARVQRGTSELQRMEQSETLSATDPLTGAYNRRTFERDCDCALQRANKTGEPLSCMLLDIDYFKHINDTYGHSVGDQALCETATAIRSQLRDYDRLYRYGGDEFCVLLKNVSAEIAVKRGEAIRKAVGSVEIRADDRSLQLRCSIGVGSCREDITVPAQLVDLADEALRLAKHSGRNQIRCLDRQEAVELEVVAGRDSLNTIRAGQLMLSPAITLERTTAIREAADQLVRLGTDSLPVVGNDKHLVGVISEQDLFHQPPNESWDSPIESIMQTNFVCFEADTPLQKIWDFFRRVALRRVVIVAGGCPVGTISRASLLRWATLNGHGAGSATRSRSTALEQHVKELTQTISDEMLRLGDLVSTTPADAEMGLICAAGRLTEQAEQLLSHCRLSREDGRGQNDFAVELNH